MFRSLRARTTTLSNTKKEATVLRKEYHGMDNVELILSDGTKLWNNIRIWDSVRYVGIGDIVSYREIIQKRWDKVSGKWEQTVTRKFLRVLKEQ